MTDVDVSRAAPVAELLAPLAAAPLGAFAVLGNHDDDRVVPAALAASGFTVLRDQRTRVTLRGEARRPRRPALLDPAPAATSHGW